MSLRNYRFDNVLISGTQPCGRHMTSMRPVIFYVRDRFLSTQDAMKSVGTFDVRSSLSKKVYWPIARNVVFGRASKPEKRSSVRSE